MTGQGTIMARSRWKGLSENCTCESLSFKIAVFSGRESCACDADLARRCFYLCSPSLGAHGAAHRTAPSLRMQDLQNTGTDSATATREGRRAFGASGVPSLRPRVDAHRTPVGT